MTRLILATALVLTPAPVTRTPMEAVPEWIPLPTVAHIVTPTYDIQIIWEPPPTTTTAADASPPSEPDPPPPIPRMPTDAVLAALRMCESTDNYATNSGNGFHGAYQFLQSTWNAAAARSGRDDLVGVPVERVAPADQDEITRAWWRQSDYRQQWPVCGPRALRAA